MSIFKDTMTVYNYFRDPDTEKEYWHRNVVDGVQWRHNKRELTTSDQKQSSNRYESITIDLKKNYGNQPYVSPQEYKGLVEKERPVRWTLDEKSGMDVLVYGACRKEIGDGYQISDLIKDEQYACIVTAVSDYRNSSHLPIIKVVAK